jgi:hypothetical protein
VRPRLVVKNNMTGRTMKKTKQFAGCIVRLVESSCRVLTYFLWDAKTINEAHQIEGGATYVRASRSRMRTMQEANGSLYISERSVCVCLWCSSVRIYGYIMFQKNTIYIAQCLRIYERHICCFLCCRLFFVMQRRRGSLVRWIFISVHRE